NQTESVNLEVDAGGNVIRTWNLAEIISAAMIAGGDDPSQFVYPAPTDWFHNNARAYRSSDNSLIVSGRENFVIAIDYDSGTIKWILGDPTKHWYQFPSLRQFSLTLPSGTLPPIGQHAVSMPGDQLLLFDDGSGSIFQQPPGVTRTYSAPRKYQIDLSAFEATETWHYYADPGVYSPICSSVYEDAPDNYVIDYSVGGAFIYTGIVGLDALGNVAFNYQYQEQAVCGTAWNAIQIHWENLQLENSPPLPTPSFVDNFTEAGTVNLPAHTADTGQGWTDTTGQTIFTSLKVSGGAVYDTSYADAGVSTYIPPSPDQEATITVTKGAITGAPDVGVALRCITSLTNPRAYIGRYVEGSGFEFVRIDSLGVSVVISPMTAGTLANGDTLRMTVSGDRKSTR